MNIFEYATREKLRFSFRGWISVECLWDLDVTQLDAIYKDLNSQLKQATEESLLQVKSVADKEIEIKIEIVKHIVTVKLDEKASKINERAKQQQKQKLLEILATKENEALMNKSPEELKAMLNELE